MKKLSYLFAMMLCVTGLALTGCGDGEVSVVEAPAEAVEEPDAMEGMTDEEYDAAMEEDMGQ